MRILLSFTMTALSLSVALAGDTTADDAAIRSRIKAHETAARTNDFAKMATGFTQDGDVAIRSNARYVVSERFRQPRPVQVGMQPSKVTMDVQSIRYVTPDVAIVESINMLNTDDTSKYRGTWVLVRKDSQWLVSAFRVLPPETVQ